MGKVTATVEQYHAAFALELRQLYPVVDGLEDSVGYKIDAEWLSSAARVLACPVKVSPPNWQHGRVLYSLLRAYCASWRSGAPVGVLDVGTAKGFSALCMARALEDAGQPGTITSVDVLDPQARVRRNTVVEVDSLRTLYEIVAPWPEARRVRFVCAKGENWLMMNPERVHFAFVDGKHTHDAVSRELGYLSRSQERGDVIVCDDLQVPGVAKAVGELRGYDRRDLFPLAARGYAILEKR